MKRYLPLLFLISGCSFFDLEPDEKTKAETDVETGIKSEKNKTPDKDSKQNPTRPSSFKEFSFERSDAPLGMSYGAWEVDGDLLRGTIEGTLLLGFPNMIGNLDNIGDWDLNFQDPCINELNYEITSITARGSVNADQISPEDVVSTGNTGAPSISGESSSTTLYKISPYGEGDAFVIIRADYTGWERPGFANSRETKEGCEDPTYPQKLELTINLDVQQPNGATITLPELCSDTPTFSEHTVLPFSSFPTKDGKKIEALNWTKLPSFKVHHSQMDLSDENVEVETTTALSRMEPGEVKIITEFGDAQIIRVAPFSETESYKLVPLQQPHTRAPFSAISLADPIRPWPTIFGFDEAQFKTGHCTVQTPTIIESKTPEICMTIESKDEWLWISEEQDGYAAQTTLDILEEGECIVEARTLTDVVQRFVFQVE